MSRDLSWLFLALFGAIAFTLALDFRMGTITNIGSAVFPLIISGLIVALSIYSFFFGPREEHPALKLRPLVAVAAAVLLFVLMLERVGMVPTIIVSMVAAYLGQDEGGYGLYLVYASIFAACTWALFSYGLGMPVPAFRLP